VSTKCPRPPGIKYADGFDAPANKYQIKARMPIPSAASRRFFLSLSLSLSLPLSLFSVQRFSAGRCICFAVGTRAVGTSVLPSPATPGERPAKRNASSIHAAYGQKSRDTCGCVRMYMYICVYTRAHTRAPSVFSFKHAHATPFVQPRFRGRGGDIEITERLRRLHLRALVTRAGRGQGRGRGCANK
jgi:hypothetical protein